MFCLIKYYTNKLLGEQYEAKQAWLTDIEREGLMEICRLYVDFHVHSAVCFAKYWCLTDISTRQTSVAGNSLFVVVVSEKVSVFFYQNTAFHPFL